MVLINFLLEISMIILDEIKQELAGYAPKLSELYDVLEIDANKVKLKELQDKTLGSDFWNDSDNSQKVLKEIKSIEDTIKSYTDTKDKYDEISLMLGLAEEDDDESLAVEAKTELKKFVDDLDALTITTLLTGEYDRNNAIVSFHPGAGGTEAQDWAEMLLRMYTRYAEKHDFKVTTLDYLEGGEAGIKSAAILIEGRNAYGFLKSEAGIHRLVRISPFDSSGSRHTSFAAVDVMPEIDDSTPVEIKPDDIKMDTYRASGAGGQHINKTDSAVRITHIPTGIVCSCQTQRSQHQNRDYALKMLKAKLIEIKEREHLEKIEDIKGEHKEIAWGAQIRSYVFMPYTLVKDHRTNCEVKNVESVMNGNIDPFIDAYLKKEIKQ